MGDVLTTNAVPAYCSADCSGPNEQRTGDFINTAELNRSHNRRRSRLHRQRTKDSADSDSDSDSDDDPNAINSETVHRPTKNNKLEKLMVTSTHSEPIDSAKSNTLTTKPNLMS